MFTYLKRKRIEDMHASGLVYMMVYVQENLGSKTSLNGPYCFWIEDWFLKLREVFFKVETTYIDGNVMAH